MQQDQTYTDDPVEIVRFLVRENGLERARQIAMEGTMTANLEGNFYRLSIWREVKHVLKDWTEAPEEILDPALQQPLDEVAEIPPIATG